MLTRNARERDLLFGRAESAGVSPATTPPRMAEVTKSLTKSL